MKRLIVIAGPTASGKSALAVEMAARMNGEVVSADSMQVYRGMEILTAVPTAAEMRGIRHHLLLVADPAQKFSAAMYREAARSAIDEIEGRGKTPILCGGTGLYIDAVTKPLSFSAEGDEHFRAELQIIAAAPDGKARLHAMLKAVDPESAARLPENDVRRIVRALEIHHLTGQTQTAQAALDRAAPPPFDAKIFALEWPREALYARIDHRVDEMVSAGMVEQVQRLITVHQAHPTAIQALGYKEIATALHGEISLPEAISRVKQGTRHYAKRQMTWFRRDERVIWLPAENRTTASLAEDIMDRLKAEEK